MSNLLALSKMLQTLNMTYKQRSGELRVFCPFKHNIPSKSPSGAFYVDDGRYHCFNCKASSRSIEDFLVDLGFDTRCLLKNHPECAVKHKERLNLISIALQACK